jgi:hypothetical protein
MSISFELQKYTCNQAGITWIYLLIYESILRTIIIIH